MHPRNSSTPPSDTNASFRPPSCTPFGTLCSKTLKKPPKKLENRPPAKKCHFSYMQTPKRLDPPLRYDLLPCHPQTPARNSSTPPSDTIVSFGPPSCTPETPAPPPGPFYRPRPRSSKKAKSGPAQPIFPRHQKRLMSQPNGAIPVDQKLSATTPFSAPRTPPCDSPGPSKPHFSPNSLTRRSIKTGHFPPLPMQTKRATQAPAPTSPTNISAPHHIFSSFQPAARAAKKGHHMAPFPRFPQGPPPPEGALSTLAGSHQKR